MPGTSPGRREPVRGVASQNNNHGHPHHRDSGVRRIDNLNQPTTSALLPWETPIPRSTTTTATANESSAVSSRQQATGWQSHRDRDNDSHTFPVAQSRPGPSSAAASQTNGWRPFSSGYPAPATAVPIFRGLRSGPALEFPDSPPSTPPRSPPLTPRALDDRRVERELSPFDEDDVSTPVAEISLEAREQNLITEAANAILAPSSSSHTTNKSQPVPMHGGGGLMPATPEMSPDQEVQHCAVKSAKAFFHKIFKDFCDEARIEDAGVELVCRGWSGAILKTGAASDEIHARQTSSSFSSMVSSSTSSSIDSKRTLYVSMPSVVDELQLREQILALLDAASEKLGCKDVVICLDCQMRDFSTVLHGLCYVGGQIVSVGSGDGQRATHSSASSDFSWGSTSIVEANSGFSPREGLVLVGIEL